MKVRLDFVTNSSSSSFIVARKGKISEQQKQKIIEYVEERFLAKDDKALKTIEDLNKYAEDYGWLDMDGGVDEYYQREYEAMQNALKQGMTVHCGYVDHEESDYHLCNMYEKIWNIMEKNGDNNFIIIDGDLSY